MHTILAISETHDASAALMQDGVIVAAAQEERFTGLKGDYGFPKLAIQSCCRMAGIDLSQVDEVVLSSDHINPVLMKIKRNANFSVNDWITEQQAFWKPKLLEGKEVNYYDLFKDRENFSYDDTYPFDDVLNGYMDNDEMNRLAEIRLATAAKLLGIPREKLRTVRHEDCHTFYAYFASTMRGQMLSLTAEGIGDYSNGSVSIFSEKGRKELASTRENHLGHIYQYITLLLGMKPNQHEFKVMGLAPYANIKEVEKSYKVFKEVLKVDGLNIVPDKRPRDLYFHFREQLEGHRFDGIAGALQQFTEELLCQWVRCCVKETGIKRVCLSGGVAQNIKAMKSIMELEEVEGISISPAAGDASLSLGACYFAMWEHCQRTGLSTSMIKPLENIYLGPDFSDEEIAEFLERDNTASRYRITKNVSPRDIAKKLSQGLIIARCSGRMEFGLRALGNRSIMADARNQNTVRKINDAIKFRDFWMPFTPTILAEREHDYIQNPKDVAASHMTMAFESTELAHKDLIAALHPADLTARPQVLNQSQNPEYHAIIKEFENITGAGGILNTSFNLHGDAIVLGPKEAVYTLDKSALDGLLLGNYLIER